MPERVPPAAADAAGSDAPAMPGATQRSGSHFADAGAAREAIARALPMIEAMVPEPEVCGSGFLYIVVVDPALTPADCRFEDAILAEHAVGDRSRWDADYAAFARAKARLAWRSGLDGRTVQDQRPHLLQRGETLLAGAVQLDGIVVGVSGAHPWYDEAFATCVAAQLRAIARRRHAEARQAGALFAGDGASA